MAKRQRIFTERLSFDRAELDGQVTIGASGIILPSLQQDFETFKKECGVTEDSLSYLYTDPKFYAGATKDSITPKKEDFLEVPFRLLSATIVGAGSWKATDFSNREVLRGSASKLNDKAVYTEHNFDLDNWVGKVLGTKWTEDSQQATESGTITVPAGIDGVIAIDMKTNLKLARGVMMGNIYSNSVTVVFNWKMSHEYENAYDFYDKIGSIGPDGRMVTRVVTEIMDYYETSLVFLGADPFAKARTATGDLKHIDVSHVRQEFDSKLGEKYNSLSFSKEEKKEKKSYFVGYGIEDNVLSLARKAGQTPPPKPQETTPKSTNMNKILQFFIATFGQFFNLKAGDTLTEDQLLENMKLLKFETEAERDAAKANKENAEGFFAKVKEVTGEDYTKASDAVAKVAFVKQEDWEKYSKLDIATLEAEAKLGKDFLEMQREEAKRMYKLSAGPGNASEAVLALFDKATASEIEGLLQTHGNTAAFKFGVSCKQCGGANISYQSSFSGDDKDKKDAVIEDDVHVPTKEDFRKGAINFRRVAE